VPSPRTGYRYQELRTHIKRRTAGRQDGSCDWMKMCGECPFKYVPPLGWLGFGTVAITPTIAGDTAFIAKTPTVSLNFQEGQSRWIHQNHTEHVRYMLHVSFCVERIDTSPCKDDDKATSRNTLQCPTTGYGVFSLESRCSVSCAQI
jgi:hypothetical protein